MDGTRTRRFAAVFGALTGMAAMATLAGCGGTMEAETAPRLKSPPSDTSGRHAPRPGVAERSGNEVPRAAPPVKTGGRGGAA